MPQKYDKSFIKAIKNIIGPKEKKETQEEAENSVLKCAVQIFSKMNTPHIIFDSEQKILYINPAFLSLIGAKETPVSVNDLLSSKDQKTFAKKTAEVFSFEEPSAFSLTVTFGGSVWQTEADAAFLTSRGGVKYAVLCVRDNTENAERKKQEDQILRDKNLLQSILDYAPFGIYTRGAKGGATFWNKKTTEMLEDTDETLMTPGAHRNQTKEEIQNYIAREEEILREGKVAVYPQESYTTREGHKVMLHLTKVPIPATGSNSACVLTIAQDITERYLQEQETAKTQKLLQTIIDNAPVAIYARDYEGQVIFRNKRSIEIHGPYDGEQNETSEQKEFYKKRDKALFTTGKLLDLPEEEYTVEGKKRIMHYIKVPVFDADKKPLLVVTIGEEVTQTREKEREIVRSQNFLQKVIDKLPLALFAKKYSGEYILWNKKCEDVFGKEAQAVIGKTHHLDNINPEQEEFIRLQDQKVFDGGREVDIPQELISTAAEGAKIMHTVKTPLFNDDGTPNCLLGISEDITAKTKMERQVYETKTKYSLLIENSREGILIVEQGNISFANQTFLSALGYEEEEIKKKTFLSICAAESQAQAKEFYEKVLNGSASHDFALIKMRNKNAEEIVEFEISSAVSKYLGKKILILFLRNITKERAQAQAVKTKEDKFREVFETANKPFVLLQNNGYIYDMNRAARDLLGFTAEDKGFYGSLYVKPGLPLKALKALDGLKSSLFDAVVDFDKLGAKFPRIIKRGVLNLTVMMTPVNRRHLPSGKLSADFLLELALKPEDGPLPEEAKTLSPDILFYQDAVLLCSREGIILKANAEAANLLGTESSDSLKGKDITVFFSENDKPSLKSDIAEVYSQSMVKSRSYYIKIKTALIPVEASAVLAKNNNFLLSLRNNAAKKQLIDTLRERSEYLQAMAHVVDGALFECDIQNGEFSAFDKVNAEACRMSGLSGRELHTLSLSDILDPAKKEKNKVQIYLSSKIEQLKKEGTISFEARVSFYEKTVTALIRISSFSLLGRSRAIIIMRDLSKERVLESELNQKMKELNGIREGMNGLYLKVNGKGVIEEYQTNDMTFNIAVFPSDFLGKSPYKYLSKEMADSVLESLRRAIETNTPVHTNFSMQYGTEHRFYEAFISPLAEEGKAAVLVNGIENKRGLENRVRDLYAISARREGGFVRTMNDILEFGKQIFSAQVGAVCHFKGPDSQNIIVNYATANALDIIKGVVVPVGDCLAPILKGEVCSYESTKELVCQNCLHRKFDVSSLIAAPLMINGAVEGLICFMTMGKGKMLISQEDRNFISFIGSLLSSALEVRQAKKAVDNSLAAIRKMISTLDSPAMITDNQLRIKNINDVMRHLCGVFDMYEVEDRNIFAKFSFDSGKVEKEFKQAYATSKGGVFDFNFEIILSNRHTLELAWHIVELRDGHGRVKGFLFVSESIKDLVQVRSLINGPSRHI